MSALATIDDVEAVVGADLGESADRVNRLIEMVTASVQVYTGQTFDQATETITIMPVDGVARLPQRPVTAVSSVTQYGAVLATNMYTFTSNGYLAPSYPPGAIAPEMWDLPDDELDDELPSYGYLEQLGKWQIAPLTVAYSHGYADGDGPDDLKLVVAEKVGEKFYAGWANAALVSERIVGWEGTYRALSAGQGWEPAHKLTLDAYRRSGFASIRLSS